jgi:hypothetical protein
MTDAADPRTLPLEAALRAAASAADANLPEDVPEAMLAALDAHGFVLAPSDPLDAMPRYTFMYPYSEELLTEAKPVLYEAIASALDAEADRLRAEVA